MDILGTPNDDTIEGTENGDVIFGGTGNDTLSGMLGDDALFGEGDNDILVGGDGADSLNGGDGDDILEGGEGADALYGIQGSDTASYRNAQSQIYADLSIVLTYQNTLGAGWDYFYSIENLIGSAFDDTLKGNGGNNILNGGSGNDILDGGEGVDTADYSDSTSGVNANLRTGLVASVNAGNDSFISIENIRASDFDDQITVSDVDNIIWGNGGFDTVTFLGTYNQYSISNIVGGPTFNAVVSGIEGVDTLNDIEKIIFSDGFFQNGVFTSTANKAPILRKDNATVDEDGSVTIHVLGNDMDENGDALTITAVSGLKNGVAVINLDNTITYTPNANYYGSESFLYTVSDGQGGTSTQRVNVTINSMPDDIEPNFAPALGKDNVIMDEDTSITINVLANDRDANGDTLTVISVNTVRNGTAVINSDNTITYTPIANFNGIESFIYTVSDGHGGTAIQRVNVTINPMPDDIEPNFAPVLGKDSASVNRNGSVTFNVLANDRDADGDTLTITSIGRVIHGSVVLNPDQTLTYTPTSEYSGTESFVYTVSDGQGGIATQRVNVTIIPNVAPSLSGDNFETQGDAPVQLNVLSNDSDINGDTLTVTAVAGLTHGTAIINSDNTITYTPTAGYVGADSFEYTVDDGHGGVITQSANIDVRPSPSNPIMDVNAAEGDKIDISALLIEYDPVSDAIADFVSLSVDGTNTVISVDRDGTDTIYAAQTVVVAENSIVTNSDFIA